MSGSRQRVDDDLTENGEGAGQTDVEARARRAGWRPREEYRGDPERWVDADQFLEVAEHDLPIAKERNKRLDQKLTRQERMLEQQAQAIHELRAMASKNEERAYERARQELLVAQAQAVETADTATYQRATAQLAELEKEKPKPAPTVAPGLPPSEDVQDVQNWVKSQDWWQKDQQLTNLVTGMHAQVMMAHPELSQMDGLRRVQRMLAEDYPDKFGQTQKRPQTQPSADQDGDDRQPNARRDAPAAVGGSELGGAAPRGRRASPKTIADLPRDEQAEARKAYLKFKSMPGLKDFTEEEYVKNYLEG
jgi:hypothetical protein